MSEGSTLSLEMTGVERTDYVRRSLALMEDTDWSSYAKLRDVTLGDQTAAAIGLYEQYGMRHPDAEDMIRMLLGRVSFYGDASALACSEQESYMDDTDALGLPPATIDLIAEGIVATMRQRWTAKGWTFVDLSYRELLNLGFSGGVVEDGYYVFSAL